jgi:hypothetical protein
MNRSLSGSRSFHPQMITVTAQVYRTTDVLVPILAGCDRVTVLGNQLSQPLEQSRLAAAARTYDRIQAKRKWAKYLTAIGSIEPYFHVFELH